jgi:hypothetical protein
MNLSLEQFERRFSPYGCRRLTAVAGIELWETGWNETFTIRRYSDFYDGDDCNRAMLIIVRTMPLEWRTASEVSRLREAIEELTEEIRKLRGELRDR